MIGRKLCKLGTKTSKPSIFDKILEDSSIATSLLIYIGIELFPIFASINHITCHATRNPDWRRMTESIAYQYGLLIVPLIPEHPAPRYTNGLNNKNGKSSSSADKVDDTSLLLNDFSWKKTFAINYKERNLKWGLNTKKKDVSKKKVKDLKQKTDKVFVCIILFIVCEVLQKKNQ